MLMLIVAGMMIWWYARFNRQAARYAVITGKNYRPRRMDLGRARWLIGGIALLILSLTVILPMLMLLWLSLQRFYRPPSLAALRFVNLAAYREVFANKGIIQGFMNSLLIGLSSSILVIVLSTLSAWFTVRRQRGGSSMYVLTFLPMGIPNIVVGISFMWLYLVLPLPLYGSHLALVFAYVTLFLAIAGRIVNAQMLQIHAELEEAAQVSGASWLGSIRTIVLPLLRPAFLATTIWMLFLAFGELQTTLLLASPDTRTAAVVMFDMAGDGLFSTVAALGIVTFSTLLAGLVVLQRIGVRAGVNGL
jgi:iron(III) transport system permease protein